MHSKIYSIDGGCESPPNNAFVSILLPVRNGAKSLEFALSSVCKQTYSNTEIIVSNNYSTDDSLKIANKFALIDQRIRVVQPSELLSAHDHFFWLADQARGDYLCWVAHDDTRTSTYIESLVGALERVPEAVLAFGDVEILRTDETVRRLPFLFSTQGVHRWLRVRRSAFLQCFHIYGVWRTRVVKEIPRNACDWWTDTPIMISASIAGDFVYVKNVIFTYRESNFSAAEKADYHCLSKLENSRVRRLYFLLRSTFLSAYEMDGIVIAVWSAWCVLERHLRILPFWLLKH